jgi:hypothetical protein
MADSTTTARDARLDALKTAVEDWAEKEITRLEDEAEFLKSILKGRTGAGRLTDQNVSDASTLVVDSISQFLTG